MLFILGHPIGGAHGPHGLAATDPHAVAHLDQPGKPTVVTEIKEGGARRKRRPVSRVISEPAWVPGLDGVQHLMGIHPIIRIECAFDGLEGLMEAWTVKLLVEITARQSFAVLAGGGAVMGDGNFHDLLGEQFKVAQAFWGFEIDGQPHVQATRRRMGIEIDIDSELLPGGHNVPGVGRQLIYRYSCVIDDHGQLVIPRPAEEQAEDRLAKLPDISDLHGCGTVGDRLRISLPCQP